MKLKTFLALIAVLAFSACGNNNTGESNNDNNSDSPPSVEAQAPTEVPAQTLKDLSYATVSSAEKLDLYVPAGTGPFPVVIYVHGGGFVHGDKSQPFKQGIVDRMIQEGYAVASVNYRLSGEALFPAGIQDIKASVRWLRANSQQYRLDPKRFSAWGDSAGGNLVSLLGTSCGDANLEGADLGNAEQSSCVQAVIDWYGPNDFLQMDQEFIDSGSTCSSSHNSPNSPESNYMGFPIQDDPVAVEKANPITYISSGDPTFFIQHGTADCKVPPQQSQLLYDALLPVLGAGKVTLTYMDGWEHGDPRFITPENLGLVVEFLNQHL